MAGKKQSPPEAAATPSPVTAAQPTSERKRWIKLTPRDHVLKQIDIQRELVEGLRVQLQNEERTLQGMEKAKEFFPD